MRFYKQLARFLRIPTNAGPNSPQIVLGDPSFLPPSIIAFYSPARVVAGIAFEKDANDFAYLVLVVPSVGTPFLACGGENSVTLTVSEAWQVPMSGVPGPHGNTPFVITSNNAQINGSAWLFVNSGAAIEFKNGASLLVDWDADFQIDPNGSGLASYARGLLGVTTATGTVSTPTGGTGTLLTFPSLLYRNGRTFRVFTSGLWSASVAGNFALFQMNNGVGTRISGPYRTVSLPVAANQNTLQYEFIFINSSGGDVTTGIQLSVTAPAGVQISLTGAAPNPVYGLVTDIGPAGPYSNFTSL